MSKAECLTWFSKFPTIHQKEKSISVTEKEKSSSYQLTWGNHIGKTLLHYNNLLEQYEQLLQQYNFSKYRSEMMCLASNEKG